MIDYEVIDGIAYIRLNRPEKLNAFTNSGLVEYVAALDRLDRDDNAQIGIVSGAGSPAPPVRRSPTTWC